MESQFGVMAGEETMESPREGRRLTDLSGREQAAVQLTGTSEAGGASTQGANTPGITSPDLEMPGSWGRTFLLAAVGY